jgi:diguanylate cyclase (GGDEF)-like protein
MLLQEREHAHNDYLTGVANVRHFYVQAQIELARSLRYKRPITIAYIDLDHFKKVNDTLGHSTGDKVLQAVAGTIRSTVRSTDFIARLGGDEFAILMPETSLDQAGIIIRKIQKSLQDMVNDNSWSITFSIGVVTCNDPGCSIQAMIREADDLMYFAKKEGKNTARFRFLNPSSTTA